MNRLILYTLIVLFILPFCRLCADTSDKFQLRLEAFHRNLKTNIDGLESKYYERAKEKKNIILKKDWCAFWLAEKHESYFNQVIDVGFNIHCISDKPVIAEEPFMTDYDLCYPKGCENGCLDLHANNRILDVKPDIKMNICHECHIQKPERWVLSYGFYFPKTGESKN